MRFCCILFMIIKQLWISQIWPLCITQCNSDAMIMSVGLSFQQTFHQYLYPTWLACAFCVSIANGWPVPVSWRRKWEWWWRIQYVVGCVSGGSLVYISCFPAVRCCTALTRLTCWIKFLLTNGKKSYLRKKQLKSMCSSLSFESLIYEFDEELYIS